jgi:pseudaminic acid cytidylyltransferase
MNLAIIPIKSKSIRIKNKNTKLFMGKPMFLWSVLAAKKSKIFDKIIVSTDDSKIVKLVTRHNIEVPFIRPKNLANNHVGILPVIKHAIKKMIKNNNKITNVCCIFAATPNINYKDLIKALKILKNKKNDFIFPVTKNKQELTRSIFFRMGKMKLLNDKFYKYRSQDLPITYNDAGQFYFAKVKTWLKAKKIFSEKSNIIIIPKNSSVDINTNEDWKKAEKIFKKN